MLSSPKQHNELSTEDISPCIWMSDGKRNELVELIGALTEVYTVENRQMGKTLRRCLGD